MLKKVSAIYPELLHYTRIEKLERILSSGSLWATEIAGLNDASENAHAYETRISAICREVAETKVRPELVDELTEVLVNTFRSVTNNVNDNFVASFSAPPDPYIAANGLLGMWARYGPVAIVLDTEQLEEMLTIWARRYRLNRADLTSVYYEGISRETQPYAAAAVTELEASLRNLVTGLIDGGGDPNPSESYEAISVLSACVKERSFSEELEVRAVAFAPVPCLHDVGSNDQRPEVPKITEHQFRRIPLLQQDPPAPLPIKRVIMAPNNSPEAARAILDAQGYRDVIVTVSSSRLRPGCT